MNNLFFKGIEVFFVHLYFNVLLYQDYRKNINL